MSSSTEHFTERLAGHRHAVRITHELVEHAIVSVAFAVTRIALTWSGLEFNFDLTWMFLSDPAELRERLLPTVLYFHAYPPGMNLVTGILFAVGGEHAELLARATFWLCSLVLANALLYSLRALAISRSVRCAVSVLFCITPACIYFENLYLYETPVAALLCLAGAFFYRATHQPSTRRWVAFFAACAVICWIRSTFHLIWFAAMFAGAMAVTSPGARRRVMVGAVGPVLLVLALYLKNFALFGVFGAASSGSGNLAHVTTMRLPRQTLNAWIREGKLSPFAGISVYASPREYLPYFDSSESKRWPELNALDRPSVGVPNYNHWFFLEVGRYRSADARYYLEQRPLEYARTFTLSLAQIFEPSTIWHPTDRKNRGKGPHHQHRALLGGYESVYNRIVHGLPWKPSGVYVFLPACLGWAIVRGWTWMRGRKAEDGAAVGDEVGEDEVSGYDAAAAKARGALLYFCSFQILFVVVLSSLATIGESSRYRFQIEAMLWLIGSACLASLFSKTRQFVQAKRALVSNPVSEQR